MKKTFLFIALVASLGGSALQAQDTIWRKVSPLDNYFYNNWLDTTIRYAGTWEVEPADVIAKRFITKDTLQVYGIAAMMTNPHEFFFSPSVRYPTFQAYLDTNYPGNPTLDSCEEKLLLYQYHGGGPTAMQLVGDSLSVQYNDVTYRMRSNTAPVCYIDRYAKPVYERYYTEPQTVYDTFYAGYTQRHFVFIETEVDYDWEAPYVIGNYRPEFQCFLFTKVTATSNGTDYEENQAWLMRSQYDPYLPATWSFHDDTLFTLYIFPILTPPDTTAPPTDTVINPIDTTVNPIDTVVVLPGDTLIVGGDTLVNTGDTIVVIPGEPVIIGGDTLIVNPGDTIVVNPGTPAVGLRQPDLIYRYTSVQPNPATDRVKVLSSFGLTRIEAYDEQGRKVSELRIPDSGPQATLDVSSWPRGTYLLRITTPVGQTTKKLLVQ